MARQFKRIASISRCPIAGTLSEDITIGELLDLITRETTLTRRMAEGRVLGNVNSILERFTPSYEDLESVEECE